MKEAGLTHGAFYSHFASREAMLEEAANRACAESAAAVPRIVERLAMMGITVPIVGDFHYNGHQLLTAEPRLRRY